MAEKSRGNIIRKKKLICLGLIILCLFSASLLALHLLIPEYLIEFLDKISLPGWTKNSFSIRENRFSPLSGTIEISGLQYSFSMSGTPCATPADNQAHSPTLTVKVNRARVSGLDILSSIFNKKVDVNKIRLSGAVIDMRGGTLKDIRQLLRSSRKQNRRLRSKLTELTILDSRFVWHRKNNLPGHSRPTVRPIEINLRKLLLLSESDHSPAASTLKIESLHLGPSGFGSPARLNNFGIEELIFLRSTQNIQIKNLYWTPVLDRYAYSKARGFQSDRISCTVPELNIADYARIFKAGQPVYTCSRISISSPGLKIFRDRRMPRRKTEKYKPVPAELLKKIKFRFIVPRVKISSGSVQYSEHAVKSDRTGKLYFSNISATVENLIHTVSMNSKNKVPIRIAIDADFMGKIPFAIRLKMQKKPPAYPFTLKGSLGTVSLVSLNRFTAPLSLIRFKSGSIKKASFSASGNVHSISGLIQVFYNNLKISKLRKRSPYKNSWLRTLLANHFIRNSNPGSSGKFRNGKISAQRRKYRSFFSFVWRGLLAGLKDSAGM